DAAHDLRRDKASRIGARQLRRGAAIVLARAIAFEAQKSPHALSHRTSTQVVFRHTKSREIFSGQIDSTAPQINADVANDVRQLQRHAEASRVVAACDVGVAEDLEADETDGRCDAPAVLR